MALNNRLSTSFGRRFLQDFFIMWDFIESSWKWKKFLRSGRAFAPHLANRPPPFLCAAFFMALRTLNCPLPLTLRRRRHRRRANWGRRRKRRKNNSRGFHSIRPEGTVPFNNFRVRTDGVQENQRHCDVSCTLEVPNLDFQPIPLLSKFYYC